MFAWRNVVCFGLTGLVLACGAESSEENGGSGGTAATGGGGGAGTATGGSAAPVGAGGTTDVDEPSDGPRTAEEGELVYQAVVDGETFDVTCAIEGEPPTQLSVNVASEIQLNMVCQGNVFETPDEPAWTLLIKNFDELPAVFSFADASSSEGGGLVEYFTFHFNPSGPNYGLYGNGRNQESILLEGTWDAGSRHLVGTLSGTWSEGGTAVDAEGSMDASFNVIVP